MSLQSRLSSTITRLQGNRFLRRLFTLSAGTAIGQALMVAVTPFLTRLFTPAEFGIFAVFSALFGMFCGVMCLRYELAVPIAESEEEAAGVTRLCWLAAFAVTAFLMVCVWLGGERLALLVDAPELATLLWLLPPALLCWGLALPLNFWSIRLGTFRTNALNRILQYATQAAGQLAFGIARAGSAGLVLGFAMGHLVKIGHFLVALPAGERHLLRQSTWSEAKVASVRYRRFPAFSILSTLFQSSSQLLPAMLVAAIYGPVVAGWFALGQRIMGFPVMMIGDAAGNVFLNEIARLRGPALYAMFRKTALRFFLVALSIMLPIMIVAPYVFALVFGEPWREAGDIVQILAPLYVVRFTAVSVSQTLNVLERQDLHLVSSLLNFAALIVSFGCGWLFGLNETRTFLFYSLGSMSAFAAYLGMAWWMARRHALAADAPSS
ncbi:MAG: oligosaccharide flippase family protein [Geminicoccaceae bacterium]